MRREAQSLGPLSGAFAICIQGSTLSKSCIFSLRAPNGLHIRGPLAILKEVWTNHHLDEETKTTYQHVIDLRNRLEGTCRLAHEELEKAGARYAKLYNRKVKQRSFQPGDKVLVLLPTAQNKLLLQWKGPFEVKEKKGDVDYTIETAGGHKVFHANLFKKYEEREGTQPAKQSNAIFSVTEEEGKSIPVPEFVKNETVTDVKLAPRLTASQRKELQDKMEKRAPIFSNVPGKTDWAVCYLETI